MDEILKEEYERNPLMQSNYVYEVPCKSEHKEKKFISRYGPKDEATEYLAMWNNKFELQHKIKVESSYNCFLFDS